MYTRSLASAPSKHDALQDLGAVMLYVAFLAPLGFFQLPARATLGNDGFPVYDIAKLRRDSMKYRRSQLRARLSRCHRFAQPVSIYP